MRLFYVALFFIISGSAFAACPPIEDGALWLPADKMFAEADFQAKAERLNKSASDRARMIPFGQPILVGHHSEGRDRNFRKKIHRGFERAYEAGQKADHYERRAAGAESNRAIFPSRTSTCCRRRFAFR